MALKKPLCVYAGSVKELQSGDAIGVGCGVGFSFEETEKPKNGGVYSLILPHAMTVPEDCAGSGFYNKTNPAAQQVVSIRKNGTEFATLTVSTSGVPTWDGSETSFAAGDRISFVFPASQDSTWAGVAITVKGA